MIGTLQQIYDDMKSDVYDFTDNGECIGCGQCCSNLLPLSSKDIKEIRRYVEKKHIKEQRNLVSNASFDMTCPFRSNDEKKCLIYPVRPRICKAFKCDLPSKDIQTNKDVLYGKYQAYSMRELFYAKDSNTNSTYHKEEP